MQNVDEGLDFSDIQSDFSICYFDYLITFCSSKQAKSVVLVFLFPEPRWFWKLHLFNDFVKQ